jgi:hypothetical protein
MSPTAIVLGQEFMSKAEHFHSLNSRGGVAEHVNIAKMCDHVEVNFEQEHDVRMLSETLGGIGNLRP